MDLHNNCDASCYNTLRSRTSKSVQGSIPFQMEDEPQAWIRISSRRRKQLEPGGSLGFSYNKVSALLGRVSLPGRGLNVFLRQNRLQHKWLHLCWWPWELETNSQIFLPSFAYTFDSSIKYSDWRSTMHGQAAHFTRYALASWSPFFVFEYLGSIHVRRAPMGWAESVNVLLATVPYSFRGSRSIPGGRTLSKAKIAKKMALHWASMASSFERSIIQPPSAYKHWWSYVHCSGCWFYSERETSLIVYSGHTVSSHSPVKRLSPLQEIFTPQLMRYHGRTVSLL